MLAPLSLRCYGRSSYHYIQNHVNPVFCSSLKRVQSSGSYRRGLHCCSAFSSSLAFPDDAFSSNCVRYLRNSSKDQEVFLVGTVHVSTASAEQVAQVITDLRADCIMVELCETRLPQFEGASSTEVEAFDPFKRFSNNFSDLFSMFSQSRGTDTGNVGSVFSIFYRLLRSMGMLPGYEFTVAIRHAREKSIPLVLGDKPINETLSQLGGNLPRDLPGIVDRVQKNPLPPEVERLLKSASNSLEDAIEMIKKPELVRLIVGYWKSLLPQTYHALIEQRDQHMANVLYHKCSGSRIVGVVGMGHLDGIEKNWDILQEAELKKLSSG